MANTNLGHKNWLGSEVGYIAKTVTVTSSSATPVTENGRSIIKSGTLINDSVLGYGLLVNDADVTDGGRVGAIMIRGTYINANLPTQLTGEQVSALAAQGLYNITYPNNTVQYGEVE